MKRALNLPVSFRPRIYMNSTGGCAPQNLLLVRYPVGQWWPKDNCNGTLKI